LNIFDFFLGCFAAINGILFGYDLGVISGALDPISSHFSLSTFGKEIMVSTLLFGALLGSPLGGFASDGLGRRLSLLMASALYCQGTLMEAFATSFWMLLLGRGLVGVGVGMGTTTAPLLVSELARPAMKGRLIAINELAVAFGVLLAFLAGYFLDSRNGWRWMLGLAGVPAICQFIWCALFPESPKYLCSRGLVKEVSYPFVYQNNIRNIEVPFFHIVSKLHRCHMEGPRIAGILFLMFLLS
jgi:MFS family permease